MTNYNDQLTTLECAIATGKDSLVLLRLVDTLEIPQHVSKTKLSRTYALLFHWILKPQPDFYVDKDAYITYQKAERLFKQTLYDDVATARAWGKKAIASAKERGEQHASAEEIAKKYNYPTEIECPFTASELYAELQPYFELLTSKITQDPTAHFTLSWSVIKDGTAPVLGAFKLWWQALETQEICEPHFTTYLEQALAFHKEQAGPKNTQEFKKLITLLDVDHDILRLQAAKKLGYAYDTYLYTEVLEDDEFLGETALPFLEMLQLLYEKQREGKRVVGPFLDGLLGDYSEGLQPLEQHPILVKNNIDAKKWLLKVALDSPEYEPYVPSAQAFWFYMHEYLDYDPKSVHQLMDGKRYRLALECATESILHGSFPLMEPVITRLIQEAPAHIATEAKRQLRIYLDVQNKKPK